MVNGITAAGQAAQMYAADDAAKNTRKTDDNAKASVSKDAVV